MITDIMKNIKSFYEFINEGVLDLIKSDTKRKDKTIKKFKKYKIGDIIKLNLFDTNRSIDAEIVIEPHWNDNEDWMQVVVKYKDETWTGYWSVADKEWKLKDKI